MIAYLLEDMNEEEAIDFIVYNTLGIFPAIPVENRPIILSEPLLLKLCPLGHRYKSRVAKASLKKPFYYC